MRLVKTRALKLSEKQTEGLRSEVLASEKADRAFFEQGQRFRNKLRGLHFEDTSTKQRSPESRITINLVHAHIRTLLPTIFFREPTVVATPKNPLQSGKEDTWNLVLNNTIKQNGFKDETKECLLDALTYFEGWKKVTQSIPEDPEQPDTGGGKGAQATSETMRGPTP